MVNGARQRKWYSAYSPATVSAQPVLARSPANLPRQLIQSTLHQAAVGWLVAKTDSNVGRARCTSLARARRTHLRRTCSPRTPASSPHTGFCCARTSLRHTTAAALPTAIQRTTALPPTHLHTLLPHSRLDIYFHLTSPLPALFCGLALPSLPPYRAARILLHTAHALPRTPHARCGGGGSTLFFSKTYMRFVWHPSTLVYRQA